MSGNSLQAVRRTCASCATSSRSPRQGSFTAAAARLHIAQQSLSQQIALIERRLGAALFDRGPHGVTPTVVGAALLPEARAVAGGRGSRVRRSPPGGLGRARAVARSAFLSSVANHLLPPVVRGLGERVAGAARSTPRSCRSHNSSRRLRDGTLDAGLSRPPLVDDLMTEEIMREPVAAVLPTGHRLAGAEALTLADLADESWVLTAPLHLAAVAPQIRP